MTLAEFVEWIQRLASEDRLTQAQADDIIEQRRMFDEHRQMLEAEYRGLVVGYCARERLVGESVTGVLDHARETFKRRRLVYFEVVGPAAQSTQS